MRKVDIPGKKPQKAFNLLMILIAILFIFIFGLIYILLVSAPPNLHKHTGPMDKQEVEVAPKTVEAETLPTPEEAALTTATMETEMPSPPVDMQDTEQGQVVFQMPSTSVDMQDTEKAQTLEERVRMLESCVQRLTEDLKKLDEATPKDVQNLEKRVNGLEVSQVLNSHLVQRLTDDLKKLREEAAKTNDVDIKTQELTDKLEKLREEAAKTKDVEVEEETDTAKDLKARVDHLMTAETTNHITIQDLTTRVDGMSDKRKVWFAARNGNKKTCDDKVIFDDVRTNMGNAYDANIGIFTAPYKGAYFFTLAYKSAGKKIHLDVYKEKDGNREYLMSLYDTTYIKDKNYMASNSRMVDLEHEEKVYVYADSDHGLTSSWSNVFSGFLVYPM
ncbi:uncharacterized protein LOC129169419 [Dunckerocampus dactyliophorus]|uniref:uncharacterized protein LOC129169419 n=1 Tax=Dunckerocampus dactyliophorus TaxID=161453 RepID=UPI00240664CD|nr:uncharacterized protein LOC129169419 [Dunckerocampus dactyliophorus]